METNILEAFLYTKRLGTNHLTKIKWIKLNG